MESQNMTTGIRNEQFRKDLATEIGIEMIEDLPLELELSIPQIEAFESEDVSKK